MEIKRKKSEYKNAIRSRKMLKQAFIKLMKEKDVEKITVTDIVKLADLNRGTFYAHYPNTRAVIEEIENEIINKMFEFLKEIGYQDFFQNHAQFLYGINHYLKSDLDYFQILINTRRSEQFLTKLKKLFVDKLVSEIKLSKEIKSDPDFVVKAHFFAGGIINTYQAWFTNNLNCSLEDIVSTVCNIMKTETTNP